jgi:hypothetical protein
MGVPCTKSLSSIDGYFPHDIVIKIKHYIKTALRSMFRFLYSLTGGLWDWDNVVMTTTSSSNELRIQIEFKKNLIHLYKIRLTMNYIEWHIINFNIILYSIHFLYWELSFLHMEIICMLGYKRILWTVPCYKTKSLYFWKTFKAFSFHLYGGNTKPVDKFLNSQKVSTLLLKTVHTLRLL